MHLFNRHVSFELSTRGACGHWLCIFGTFSPKPHPNTRATAEWGYNDDNGALMWYSLDPANRLCGTGRNQSPINLDNVSARVEDSSGYALDYSARLQDVPFHNPYAKS